MHKRLCLCPFLSSGNVWGGDRGAGKGISRVQVLSEDMTDGVVKAHKTDPEAEDTWWQTIKVGLAKEGYQKLVLGLQEYCLANDVV